MAAPSESSAGRRMSLCKHFRRVRAVLADMDLGEANARAEALLGQPVADPSEDVLGERLAADVRKDDELYQTNLFHCSHLGEQRIVRSDECLVIEGFLQPPSNRFQAAEVHDPASSIEVVGFELQVYSERVPVKEPAVRG